MKLTIISDMHTDYRLLDLSSADVLIVAGDIDTYYGQPSLYQFNCWLERQPFTHKIIVAGNHDRYLAEAGYKSVQKQLTNGIYLENSSVTVEGIKFYGSPITPTFLDWWFMADRDKISKYWDMIPNDTDVLITHGPPYGILDYVNNTYNIDHHVGCKSLLQKVNEIKPMIHCFGHIHCGYGIYKTEHTTFINASIMDESYTPVNKPITIEI